MMDKSSLRIVKQLTRCSLAIRFIDTYTGKAPNFSGLKLHIENVIQQPIIKADGYVIYTNLSEGQYTCSVRTDYYMPVSMILNVDNKQPMVLIAMKPNPSYPLGPAATYIRLAVKDENGRLLDGANITATCTSENYAKAVLSQEVEIGSRELMLTHIKGKITEGDFFLITKRGKVNHCDEYCCISREIDGFRNFMLDKPLQSAYPKGAMLLTAVKTQTNGTGEAVIPFRNPLSNSFIVHLTVEWKDYIMVREVEVKEAEATHIGVIHLSKTNV